MSFETKSDKALLKLAEKGFGSIESDICFNLHDGTIYGIRKELSMYSSQLKKIFESQPNICRDGSLLDEENGVKIPFIKVETLLLIFISIKNKRSVCCTAQEMDAVRHAASFLEMTLNEIQHLDGSFCFSLVLITENEETKTVKVDSGNVLTAVDFVKNDYEADSESTSNDGVNEKPITEAVRDLVIENEEKETVKMDFGKTLSALDSVNNDYEADSESTSNDEINEKPIDAESVDLSVAEQNIRNETQKKKRKRYTIQQKIVALDSLAAGQHVVEVSQRLEISVPSLRYWKYKEKEIRSEAMRKSGAIQPKLGKRKKHQKS